MANSKISALTSATTPLAGTETLPIVQGGTTKQVSVANLTAGRAVDTAALTASGLATFSVRAVFGAGSFATNKIYTSATNGLLITGKTGSANDLSIVAPGGNIALAIPTNTEDIKINLGNIVQGTAAKGINFTANTGAAGKTSQLLNWYEEGTFTPTYTSDGTPPTCTYSIQDAKYTRIGRMVYFSIEIRTTTASGGTGNLQIAGLPFTSVNSRYSGTTNVGFAYAFTTQCPTTGYIPANSTTLYLCYKTSATEISNISAGYLTNAAASNYLLISGSYVV